MPIYYSILDNEDDSEKNLSLFYILSSSFTARIEGWFKFSSFVVKDPRRTISARLIDLNKM